MTKSILITSGKGGTGKTTTAINLANSLMGFGRSVVVVDADLEAPNLALYLGVLPNHPIMGSRPEDCIHLHPSGLRFISPSIAFNNDRTDPESMSKLISHFKNQGEIVIIDYSATIGEHSKELLYSVDEVIIVTTPEIPAVSDALRTIKAVELYGAKVSGIVLNRHKGNPVELNISNVEAMLDKQVLETIPDDDSVRESVSMKNPVTSINPYSDISIKFKKLAAKVIGETYTVISEHAK